MVHTTAEYGHAQFITLNTGKCAIVHVLGFLKCLHGTGRYVATEQQPGAEQIPQGI